jgi:hypothetical protein
MPLALTKKPATTRSSIASYRQRQTLSTRQHSLNELLLGEVALTPIRRQLSYIAQQAHQRFAQTALRFKGQRDKQAPRGPLASVLESLLFVAVSRGGASFVCCSAANGDGFGAKAGVVEAKCDRFDAEAEGAGARVAPAPLGEERKRLQPARSR